MSYQLQNINPTLFHCFICILVSFSGVSAVSGHPFMAYLKRTNDCIVLQIQLPERYTEVYLACKNNLL